MHCYSQHLYTTSYDNYIRAPLTSSTVSNDDDVGDAGFALSEGAGLVENNSVNPILRKFS